MKKMNFFKKVELVISHPHKFFDKIGKEKKLFNVFEFYFIFVFLSLIINTLFLLPTLVQDKLKISFLNYTLFIITIIIILTIVAILTALLSFVLYWVYHIIIKLFRGQKRYPETYKLLYAATPLLIVTLIPFSGFFKLIFYPLFIIATLDTFYIEFIALKKLHKMSNENAIFVILIGAIIGILTIICLIKRGVIII
tara:strand:+ start:827 stop:1414 length:588 start_codon:yes stop_codon:yes gene_type:complete